MCWRTGRIFDTAFLVGFFALAFAFVPGQTGSHTILLPATSVTVNSTTEPDACTSFVASTRIAEVLPGANAGTTVLALVDFVTAMLAIPLPESCTVIWIFFGGPATVAVRTHVGIVVSLPPSQVFNAVFDVCSTPELSV